MSWTLQPLKPDLLKVCTPASSKRPRTSWDDNLAMELDMTSRLKCTRGNADRNFVMEDYGDWGSGRGDEKAAWLDEIAASQALLAMTVGLVLLAMPGARAVTVGLVLLAMPGARAVTVGLVLLAMPGARAVTVGLVLLAHARGAGGDGGAGAARHARGAGGACYETRIRFVSCSVSRWRRAGRRARSPPRRRRRRPATEMSGPGAGCCPAGQDHGATSSRLR